MSCLNYLFTFLFVTTFSYGSVISESAITERSLSERISINEYDINLFDENRKRSIPIAVYAPVNSIPDGQVVIMNHGYDQNKGGSYKVYSYLTRALAENGYFVISIQHELPDDDLLAMEGNLYETRMPNWERGVENIVFTIDTFKNLHPEFNWKELVLIGHSNGGDMAMLYATQYPSPDYRIISLDHRRMPIPRNKDMKICSLRGCDYPADEGVLPDEIELQEYPITLIWFSAIKHGDMDDKGTDEKKAQIIKSVIEFLKE